MESKIPRSELEAVVAALHAADGVKSVAARNLGLTRNAFAHRIALAELAGMIETSEGQALLAPLDSLPVVPTTDLDLLRKFLRSGKGRVEDIAKAMGVTRGAVIDGVDALRTQGYGVHEDAGLMWLDTTPEIGTYRPSKHEYLSREDGTYIFGFTSDNHLGSKYSRLDVLEKLYARFAEVGVDRVFNAGNWIDGEANFNKHDLLVHGMHQQCKYLADHWPKTPGLTTYAVTGDDHEGWYSQREGVDIGRYAEQMFKDAGRNDWVDLGYMEADIALVNAKSGVRSRLRVAHPGGGSAYATSYAPQKYVESLAGGEKPALVLLGHWHKLEFINIRNVWVIQTGCTQDQTPFGRKKKLDFQVGGGICSVKQDPDTGALTNCTVELMQFFNRAHYGTGRWSHHADVTMADRVI